MDYVMFIYNIDTNEEFDVSELVHDIEYTTSLQGQAGRLTFRMEKDPNGILSMSMGSRVRFWNDGIPIFLGYIFTMGTNRDGIFSVTAYDQMRYLKNHYYYTIKETDSCNNTVSKLFADICQTYLKLKDKGLQKSDGNFEGMYDIRGSAITDNTQLKAYHFNDKSLFDILDYALNQLNNVEIKNTKQVYHEAETYTVQSGDTLSEIAVKYGVSMTQLIEWNSISDPNVLGIGQVLTVKPASTTNDVLEEDAVGNKIEFKRYYVHDEFGTLVLDDCLNNLKHKITGLAEEPTDDISGKGYVYDENQADMQPLIIGAESLLTDYTYELSIENCYNDLELVTDKIDPKTGKTVKQHVMENTDGDLVKKWGLLRKIVNIKNGFNDTEIKNYAEMSMNVGKVIQKTLRIDALGFNGLVAGDGFQLHLPEIGIDQMMYVISATHRFGADIHTMSLDVSTQANLNDSFQGIKKGVN